MQAIILAAGMGKRLGEYTKNCTKCMVPVNGVTLIDRLLGQLSKLGLNRIVIVVGYKGKELIDYVGKEYMGLKIEYIKNPIYDRTNNIYKKMIHYLLRVTLFMMMESLIFLLITHIQILHLLLNMKLGWMELWYALMKIIT